MELSQPRNSESYMNDNNSSNVLPSRALKNKLLVDNEDTQPKKQQTMFGFILKNRGILAPSNQHDNQIAPEETQNTQSLFGTLMQHQNLT